MSTIKQKIGNCQDCDNGKQVPLLGGRCKFHYWKHRSAVNASKKSNVAKNETRKKLNVFFASQVLQIPSCCENCGDDLTVQKRINAKSIIAHILPKRPVGGFPAVATHPKNRLFLCLECHTNFDNKGEEFAIKMTAFPLIVARFNEFSHLLSEADKQRLPSYLKNI